MAKKFATTKSPIPQLPANKRGASKPRVDPKFKLVQHAPGPADVSGGNFVDSDRESSFVPAHMNPGTVLS